ncbi:MAG TPA: hypothetical protein VF746_15905 [Longimicrobium sp.]
MLEERHVSSPLVLVRDAAIFYVKLLLDGLKDVVLIQVGLLAFCVDLIFMLFTGRRRSRFFYSVLALGEKIDLWLNLYGAAKGAGTNPDGLFGESRAGDDTLLGELELLARKEERAAARPAARIRPRPGIGGA